MTPKRSIVLLAALASALGCGTQAVVPAPTPNDLPQVQPVVEVAPMPRTADR